MPPQLRALFSFTLKYGAMPAVGVYLVWWLTHKVDAALEAQQLQVKQVAEKLDAHNAAMQQDAVARQATDGEVRRLLRGICIGTSGDIPSAKAFCNIEEDR